MNRISNIIILAIMLLMASAPIQAADNNAKEAKTIRKERNLIREGNKLYNDKRFAEAEVKYRQALGANPDSEIGLYNLAASLIKQAGKEDKLENRNSPIFKADSILNNLVAISKDPKLTSRAFYNLGNIAFNEEKYDRSVAMYRPARICALPRRNYSSNSSRTKTKTRTKRTTSKIRIRTKSRISRTRIKTNKTKTNNHKTRLSKTRKKTRISRTSKVVLRQTMMSKF